MYSFVRTGLGGCDLLQLLSEEIDRLLENPVDNTSHREERCVPKFIEQFLIGLVEPWWHFQFVADVHNIIRNCCCDI